VAAAGDVTGAGGGTSLPSHAEDRRLFLALADLLQGGWPTESAVAWVAGPWLLAEAQTRAGIPYREPEPIGEQRLRLELRRSNLASLVDWPIRGMAAGPALLLPATENQERVLRPIAELLGEVTEPRRVRARRRRAAELGREAIDSWRRLLAAMRESGTTAPWPAVGALRTLLASARFLAYAETAVPALRPAVLVLGSTHNGAERAFARTARDAGVPTVYFPHAPALSEARINDLPVDYAGLRGEREIDLFAERGADTGGLEVTGDPAISAEEPPRINPELPPVLAVSPVTPENLAQQIDLVRAAAGDDVILSPHPRSDPRALREMAPPGWRLFEERTHSLLRQGPPVLIQRSSGVCLEALQLGIPTVQLSFPGDVAGYPLIAEPAVRSASSTEQLADAIERGREAALDEGARRTLIEWARQWAWPLGDEAAELGAGLVRRAQSEGPRPEPIWDAWRDGPRG
jgi:hypothetical protein